MEYPPPLSHSAVPFTPAHNRTKSKLWTHLKPHAPSSPPLTIAYQPLHSYSFTIRLSVNCATAAPDSAIVEQVNAPASPSFEMDRKTPTTIKFNGMPKRFCWKGEEGSSESGPMMLFVHVLWLLAAYHDDAAVRVR